MYTPSVNDSTELTEARVEIQQFLDSWLREPWLIMGYAKHLLFYISILMFVFKFRNSYNQEQEYNARVKEAYAEARRRYHTNPNEMFDHYMTPPEDDDDVDDGDDDGDEDTPKY